LGKNGKRITRMLCPDKIVFGRLIVEKNEKRITRMLCPGFGILGFITAIFILIEYGKGEA